MVLTVTPSAPHWRPQPLASTRTPSATAASIVNSAAPAMPTVGTTNTRLPALARKRLGAGARQPPRRGQAALAPAAHVVLVEVHEPVRRHDARRQPRVHDLVDAAEALVGRRQRVDDLGLGPEVAVERERGDAELLQSVEQSVGEARRSR